MKIVQNKADSQLPEVIAIEAQAIPGITGQREIEVHISYPACGINENTGLMLVSHNWGGTWEMCWEWCKVLANKFNLVCIDTNYFQSGQEWREVRQNYDHGFYQAGDCLRALYEVRRYLDENNIVFNRRRTYAAGASGGGNVSQMVNKFAPHTFGCIIDLCGMSYLSERVAFGLAGRLNAGYSRDLDSPYALTPAKQEIRDLRNLEHLAIQYKCNPDNQVVIVHGLDDDYCPCEEKIEVFGNMIRAGFKPEGHFITKSMVDGIFLTGSGHALGDRAYIIAKYGQKFIAEKGEHIKLVEKDDFDRQSLIEYPVTGGVYQIDYRQGSPLLNYKKF